MRRLFLAILIPVVAIVGTPAIFAAIMYDNAGANEMPTYLYVEDADAEAMIYEELSASLADVENEATDDLVFNLHQDVINTAIFQYIRSEDINPDYMPTDTCTEDACRYIFSSSQDVEGFNVDLRVVGAWVSFEEGQFITNVYLEIQLNGGFTYKTNFQTYFNITDLPDKYIIEFDKIKLGKMPIPKSLISKITSTIESQIEGVDLEEGTSDLPIGTFDTETISYTVLKDEIVSQFEAAEGSESESQDLLIKEILSIVFENQLLNFSFEDDEFVLTAAVSKFRSDEGTQMPAYLNDLHFQEVIGGETVIGAFDPDSFDPETYLTNKFSEYVFNYALVDVDGDGEPDPFRISEQSFNKLIYDTAEGFSDTRMVQELPDGNGGTEEIEIGVQAIWFDLEPTEIYVNALFSIGEIQSMLRIKAEEISTSDQELVFEFTEITFGKDEGESDGDYLDILDLEAFKQVFAEFGDVEFGAFNDEGNLVITADRLSALMQEGTQEGVVTVTSISLALDGILLNVEPTNPELTQALQDFSEELEEVFTTPELLTDLETVLDSTTPGPGQDVYNGVVAVQDLLNDGDPTTNPTAEELTEIFENFELLDATTQQEFLETFEDAIDPAILAQFEDLF